MDSSEVITLPLAQDFTFQTIIVVKIGLTKGSPRGNAENFRVFLQALLSPDQPAKLNVDLVRRMNHLDRCVKHKRLYAPSQNREINRQRELHPSLGKAAKLQNLQNFILYLLLIFK
jgi:hypothetical protein